MSPALDYTTLTPRQIEARRESIARLKAMADRYPNTPAAKGFRQAIEEHESVLKDGARLIENPNID